MEIHEILSMLREEKGAQQKEVSTAIHVGISAISNYEKGRSSPSNTILVNFADYYDVSTDYLLGRTSFKLSLAKLEKLLKTSKDDVLSLDILTSLSPESREILRSVAAALYENEQLKKQDP